MALDPEEKLRKVEEIFLLGKILSFLTCRHEVGLSQLFGRRRQAAMGAWTSTRTGGEVVPASRYRAFEDQVRQLERMVGKTSMGREILCEAI